VKIYPTMAAVPPSDRFPAEVENKEVFHPLESQPPHAAAPPLKSPFWKRKRFIIPVGVLVFIIIVAVVLGAVLGTQLHKKSSSKVKQGSYIGATGWRPGSENYNVELLYQYADGSIGYATFSTYWPTRWASAQRLSKAASGSPIAVSSFNKQAEWGLGQQDVRFLDLFYS
jgi:hypothetical protein